MPAPMTHNTHTSQSPADWEGVSMALRAVAGGLTSDPAERDDLVQETLASLLAKAPGMAGHRGYARSVMVRLWLDRQRSLKRRLGRLARAALTRPSVHHDHPPADRDELLGLVREAIESLPARQRAAIVLRLVEGLSYAEIAGTLGCDERSARSNLHLARQKLRRTLGDHA